LDHILDSKKNVNASAESSVNLVSNLHLTSNLQLGQITPASSRCWQLWTPIPAWVQLKREDSDPVHLTLSRSIESVPCPNGARESGTLPKSSKIHHKLLYHYR